MSHTRASRIKKNARAAAKRTQRARETIKSGKKVNIRTGGSSGSSSASSQRAKKAAAEAKQASVEKTTQNVTAKKRQQETKLEVKISEQKFEQQQQVKFDTPREATPDLPRASLINTLLDPRISQEAFGKTDLGASIQKIALDMGISPNPDQKLLLNTIPSFVSFGARPRGVGRPRGLGLFAGKLGSRIRLNSKTARIGTAWIVKNFGSKSVLALGGLIAAAASAMFFGLWAKAEAAEPITFAMGKVLTLAAKTGNWTLYDEAAEARDEILNSTAWEEKISNSPLSPLVNIPLKLEGLKAGARVMDQLKADLQKQQEDGESEADKWARVREQEREMDRQNIDYYNEQRRQQLVWESEARANDRKEEAAFWASERAKQRIREAEDRQAIAEFWLAYRKEAQKLQEESRPSKLNFGLL